MAHVLCPCSNLWACRDPFSSKTFSVKNQATSGKKSPAKLHLLLIVWTEYGLSIDHRSLKVAILCAGMLNWSFFDRLRLPGKLETRKTWDARGIAQDRSGLSLPPTLGKKPWRWSARTPPRVRLPIESTNLVLKTSHWLGIRNANYRVDIVKTLPRCYLQTYMEEPGFSCQKSTKATTS